MRVLLISGVKIGSGTSAIYEQGPTPDFKVLRERLEPDVLDVASALENADGVLRAIAKRLDPCWAVALTAFRRRKSYDVIAATGEDVGFRLALICKMLRTDIPIVVSCHNIATRRPRFFLRQLGVGSNISVFQCLAQKQIDMLAEQMPLAPGQAQLIYCGVDHKFFRPRPDAVIFKDRICSAGMASRDYATLVKAVAPIDVDLKIAADSPWFKQSLNISDSDLSPRVEVRSYKTYAMLRELYASSYAVVVPLIDVPFSAGYSVILEAMAMGKPVIVTRITQKDDFVIDGWNGLYVSPNNVDELREKIRFLMDNPDEAARMGTNARKTIEDRFTLNHYVDRFQQTIESVVLSASAGHRQSAGADVSPGAPHGTPI